MSIKLENVFPDLSDGGLGGKKAEEWEKKNEVEKEEVEEEDIDESCQQFKCGICPFTCKLGTDMAFHETVHADQEPKLTKKKEKALHHCQYCPKVFSRPNLLTRHEMLHRGEKKTYQCSKCSFSAWRQNEMERHERVHTGEKPFKCDKCDYSGRY